MSHKVSDRLRDGTGIRTQSELSAASEFNSPLTLSKYYFCPVEARETSGRMLSVFSVRFRDLQSDSLTVELQSVILDLRGMI